MVTISKKPRDLFVKMLSVLILACGIGAVEPQEARAGAGNWVVKTVRYSSWNQVATTGAVTLYTTKDFETVEAVIMRVNTDFSGGALASYTISVGKSGAVDKYQTASSVFTGVTTGNNATLSTFGISAEPKGTAIIATATGSGNLSTATAGEVTFYILVSALPPR